MNARTIGRPFVKGRSGNPGGRPRVAGTLRDLARAHAPEAIEELARLALKAKSETARIAAIRELLDRGYGKPLQFLAADDDAIPPDMTADELREDIIKKLDDEFPGYRFVPVSQLSAISGSDVPGSMSLRQIADSHSSKIHRRSRYVGLHAVPIAKEIAVSRLVDLSCSELDHQTTQTSFAPFSISAHAFRRGRGRNRWGRGGTTHRGML
jgi:hypothetical protein